MPLTNNAYLRAQVLEQNIDTPEGKGNGLEPLLDKDTGADASNRPKAELLGIDDGFGGRRL